MNPAKQVWRRVRASWRDTLLLLREFRLPLLLFILAVMVSGWFYYQKSGAPTESVRDLVDAMYITMMLAFFQPVGNFPPDKGLRVFYFVMPIIGISLLAQGLAEFGVMLFNRSARSKEWEMAVASTYKNHAILVGLGHLGYRVVKMLTELEQDVVVIEKSPEADLLSSVRDLGIPALVEDGMRETVLAAAGVSRAKTIILCTQDDILNLRIALKARSLNPSIDVVIRIFDEDFAASLQSQFGFRAMSATSMAAPLFAASAAHVDLTHPILIGGKAHILARLEIGPRSHLHGRTVSFVEECYRLSIVLISKGDQREFHPAGEKVIESGQAIAVFGEPENIHTLLHENKS